MAPTELSLTEDNGPNGCNSAACHPIPFEVGCEIAVRGGGGSTQSKQRKSLIGDEFAILDGEGFP